MIEENKMKKIWIGFLAVAAAAALLTVVSAGGMYNRLVASDEQVTSALGQVQSVYQRRLDLIPNLVETVKGSAAHEQKTLEGIVSARSKIAQMNVSSDMVNNPEALSKFQQAQQQLSGALSRLLVVVEQYPDLKANQNFLALQSQLEGTENRIAVERMRFNESARGFNTLRRSFPTNIVANVCGFKEKAYFQADDAAAKAPAVKF